MEIITNDDRIEVKDGRFVLAKFEDSGNGMDGEICEGNEPRAEGGRLLKMRSADLIAVARWILAKAEERAQDEESI
jgi:hypothetical protein